MSCCSLSLSLSRSLSLSLSLAGAHAHRSQTQGSRDGFWEVGRHSLREDKYEIMFRKLTYVSLAEGLTLCLCVVLHLVCDAIAGLVIIIYFIYHTGLITK